MKPFCLPVLLAFMVSSLAAAAQNGYDTVIANGRVMDPESGLEPQPGTAAPLRAS